MGPLKNARQEKFCLLVFQGMSQTDAYLQAGYKNKYPNKVACKLPQILAVVE